MLNQSLCRFDPEALTTQQKVRFQHFQLRRDCGMTRGGAKIGDLYKTMAKVHVRDAGCTLGSL